MNLEDEFNADIAEMDSCSNESIQSFINNANAQLLELNVSGTTSTRQPIDFKLPITIPDICIDPVLIVPTYEYTLEVDLQLFKQLFWYKNFSYGFAKYTMINETCLILLKSINFLDATRTGGITLLDDYETFIDSTDTEDLVPFIQQKIKTSLYQRFYTMIYSLTTDKISSVVNTCLNKISLQETVLQSSSSYSLIPFMEEDTILLCGTITSDIPTKTEFNYGITLELVTNVSTDYSMINSTYESTDTFIVLPTTIPANINEIVRVYIPVNLDYTTYKTALYNVYSNVLIDYSSSFAQGDAYHALYVTTNSYIYEMYAIGICASIALYYRGYTLNC